MNKYIEMINDLDTLVGTRPEYHLSNWINMARDCGKTKKEKDLYEYNASRWQIFFDEVKKSKDGKIDVDKINKKRMAWETQWIESTKPVKESPTGNEIKIAKAMLKKYRNYND